jgi:hypothetical protein
MKLFSSFPGGRKIRRCLFLCLLVLPAWGNAQPKSTRLPKTALPVIQSSRLPLLDPSGECLAWRESSKLAFLDRGGQTVAEINGTFIECFASADANTIAALEKVSGAKEKDDERVLTLHIFAA